MSSWLKSALGTGTGSSPTPKKTISSDASKTGLQSLHTDLLPPSPIVKVNLPLPMLRPSRGSNDSPSAPLAFYLDNVFTPLECREMIRLTEAVGYGAALINVGGGRQKLISDVRDSTRCMVDDGVVAQRMYERIAPYLPQKWDMPANYNRYLQVPKEANLVSLNERLRFLRYTKGQKFLPHYDGSYCRPYTDQVPFPEQSFVTVQLYLNDGEGSNHPDFGGGSTAFLLNNDYVDSLGSSSEAARHASDPDKYPESLLVHCHPRAGRVLVFQHNLLHQGSPVTSGVKYCLRTDAMYKPDSHAKASSLPLELDRKADAKPQADSNAVMRD